MVPHLLHILPGLNDTRGDGVVEVEDTHELDGLVSDVLGLGATTLDGDSAGAWASDNGGEDALGGVLAGETGLDHS